MGELLGPLSQYHCHCEEPLRAATWQSVLFVANRATRPKGALVCLRRTQVFDLQGKRIATPVCALARNDMEIWWQPQNSYLGCICESNEVLERAWHRAMAMASAASSGLGIWDRFKIRRVMSMT